MIAVRHVARVAMAGMLAWATASSAAAEFPEQPIKIVHGSAAGAPQDVMMRTLAEHLEEAAGVPIVVEPRPGGSGQVAMAYLKGQAPDGYTVINEGTGITAILQLPGAAHSWEDFKPLYRIQLDPFALYVQRDGDYANLEDLIADLEERGDQVRIGGYGTGSPHHLTTLALAEAAGVDVSWVPYNSGSDAIAAVMAGDLEAAMSNISVYNRFIEQTQVVAVTAEERLESFPDVPTLRDEGYDLARYHWRGVLVHADTPDHVVGKLHAIFDEAVNSPEFLEYLSSASTLPGTMSQADFQTMLEEQAVSDRKTLIDLGMIQE